MMRSTYVERLSSCLTISEGSIKMEVSNMTAFDEHTCVYCRNKINGLNNYIEHLKACEPFESFDTKVIPRLPFLRSPSRESLQSDVLESSAESRCSSPDSYMQRIYNDMYRYEKIVLDSNSIAEASNRVESKNDEENGDKGLLSMRWPAMPCQTVMCAQSPRTDRNDPEGLEGKLKELSMGLDSKISGKTVANSVDGVTEKSEENVLNESQAGLSLAFSENIDPNPEEISGEKCRERTSRKLGAVAQYLSGINPPNEISGNSCGCGLGFPENIFSEPRSAVIKRCLMENVAPSAGIDTASINQTLVPMQNIPVSTKYEKVDPRNSSLSSGFTSYCDGGVKIYKVWGDTAESLAASFKDCMLGIFCALTSTDKKKVLDEVERLCDCYTSTSGTIQIKIVQAINKMNLLIKKIETSEKDDGVKLGETAAKCAVGEKKNGTSKAVLCSAIDKESFPKMMANLSESPVRRPCKRNISLGRIPVDESVHKHGEVSIAKKENVPTAAAVSPASVCEKDYLRKGHFQKSPVHTTTSLKISEENVLETRNITPKLDLNYDTSKERTLGDLVARSPNNDGVKGVCDDGGSLGNQEIIPSVFNPHISNNIFPISQWECALKGTADVVFEKDSSKFGTFFDTGVDSLKISKDNIIAACTSNEDIMLAENISNATIVSQKKSMQARGTIVGGGEKGDACELKNSQHNLSSPVQKRLKSPMAPSPWHELADTLFFSSVEDVGLEVEVGPNETSSFVSEDSPMKEINSLLIPLQFVQKKAAAARGSCLTRQCRRSCSRGRGGWRKVQRIREMNEEGSGELLFQEGNNSRSKTRGRHTRNGCRNRIFSRKTLCNRKDADRVTRMGPQRYNLRTKSVEGCATVVSSQVAGKKSVDASVVKESQDSGVKLSQPRLEDEVMEGKREFIRKRGRKRVIESTLVAEGVMQEHRHAEAVVNSKESSNIGDDNPVSTSYTTVHSKCVKDQVSTVSSVDILTNEDNESVSGLRGFNLPLQKKSFSETRSGDVAKDRHSCFIKRRKKLKCFLDQEKMNLRKTCQVTMRRDTSERSKFSSEFINTQIGYSLRNRVLQMIDAKTLPASVPEYSEEDAEQKRPNAPCPAGPVSPIEPIRRGRLKRKQSCASSENGGDVVKEETINGEVAEAPKKSLREKRHGKKLKFTSIKRNTRAAVKESRINLRDAAGSLEAQITLSTSKKTRPNLSLSNIGLHPANIDATLHLNSQTLEEAINCQPKIPEAPVIARKLDKNQLATSCLVLNFSAENLMRLHQKRVREQAERDEVIISESAVCRQVGDGVECRRNQNLDQITASSKMADEGIDSLGHVTSPTPTTSLYNEMVEMKSLRKSVSFRKPAIVQNNAAETYSMDINCAKTEELPAVQRRHKGRSRLELLSVKLNHDDKEGLELMKTLKPFSIDLGLRCDSKKFLSQLCATYGKHFVAAAINVKQAKRKQSKKSRTSLSYAENGKESPKSTTGHLTLDGHESERRTKINRLERSTSQNPSMEEMPASIPEFSVMQEVCGPKISNYNVKNASQGPRVENKVIDVDEEDARKPIQVSSRLIDDNEVQIVLELVKPEKKFNLMQAYINRLKGWREAESVEEEFVTESLSSVQPSSHNEPNHVIRRDEEVFERMTLEFPNKKSRERLSSTHSVMTSGMEMLMFNKKKEQEDSLNKAEGLGEKLQFDESVPCTALSNIVVTNVRSGAELTEEERDIPLSLEYDELSAIRGQTDNELRGIPAEGDTEMSTPHVDSKKYDLNVFVRKNANTVANTSCGNESCMSGDEVTESLQENVIHLAGYNNLDSILPDVVKVSHSNLSHGITMPKEKEPSIEKYGDKGALSEGSILPRLAEFGVSSQQYDQSNDESIQIEKFIPLITLSPQKMHRNNVVKTTEQPKSQILQNNLSKPVVYHSNKSETIKQLIKGSKNHQIEGMYPSDANLALEHLTCKDSVDSIPHRKTIPSMMLSPQKMSRAVVIPAALCCQLEQADYHSSSFRTPFRENNWDAIPQNLASACQETSNDLCQCSLEENLPVTATVPPNILSKVKALTGYVPCNTQDLIVLPHDQCNFQKLGHNSCTPSQEVSITGTVNPGTSGCSLGLAEHHKLFKLGEIMSNSGDILKKELNTLANSLGMKVLITRPGRNQLGKFILYNIKEKKPESNIIRVDYCKNSQMKQKS